MSTESQVFTVGEITSYLKQLLEAAPLLRGLQVKGEVSNIKYHSSGHVYFSVKDLEAQMSCVMFRSYAAAAPRMSNGDKVIVQGNMTVYPPRGNYQLMVQRVSKETGKGDLYQQFLQLKEKLQKEGLFDRARKRAIPAFPKRVAVLSSPTSAAIRDVIRTLYRRYDALEVLVVPTVVQGDASLRSIIRSLEAVAEQDVDTAILARGGGSMEDLWSFNDEQVARAIVACPIPLITGIGHETDFTIADFVADARASTPTAAAERAVPEKAAIFQTLYEYDRQLKRGLQYFIDFKRQVLDDYHYRLEQAVLKAIRDRKHELALLEAKLKGMDVTSLLEQGYTLTLKGGKIQPSRRGIAEGDAIETVFSDGRVSSTVNSTSS